MPDLNKIIDDLSKLTVAEAADLSKQLEEKWGVTPMAAAAPAAAGGAAAAEDNKFTWLRELRSPSRADGRDSRRVRDFS